MTDTQTLGSGGGKPSSQRVASLTNAIEDAIWAVASLTGGWMLNTWGPAYTLAFGASGFPIYLAGFWIYDRTGIEWVPIFMGAISGLTAGGLWCVQNWTASCYPQEQEKGKYVFMNWFVSLTPYSTESGICSLSNSRSSKPAP